MDNDKLRMQTPDIMEENFKKLQELFPSAVTETIGEDGKPRRTVDADVLCQLISADVAEGREERYQFTWPEKAQSVLRACAPTRKTLRLDRGKSVGRDGTAGSIDTENIYIEGDNLEALKILQETYLGKIKMIYIDPPYNTGNDFIYRDDFSEDEDEYWEESGQLDEEGGRLVQNMESSGRFHTNWLNMIYPRLWLARDLLAQDGVIFISIDEVEVNNLQKICDEIFGASNFVSQLVWAAGRKNDSKYISVSHEFILCYVRNMEYLKAHKITWREKKQGLADIYAAYGKLKAQYGNDTQRIQQELKSWYKNLPDGHPAKDHQHYSRVDEKGIYFADNISWPGGGGPKYEVLHPVTHKPVAVPSRGWITSEKNLKEWIKQGRVDFGANETYVPTLKAYLKDREYSVPYSVFYQDGRAASKRLAALMGNKVFENPKDEEVIQRLIEFCGVSDGDVVMDFFSGSGTTAHSVMLASSNMNKSIRYILVQIQEEISPKKASSEKGKKVANDAIKLCDELGRPHTICEIGEERIRRAGRQIMERELEGLAKEGVIEKCALDAEVDAAAGIVPSPALAVLRRFGYKVRPDVLVDAQGGQASSKLSSLSSKLSLDTGFRVFYVDSSNMKDVWYTPEETAQEGLGSLVDNIKDDRTAEDLLFQAMLELGIELSADIAEEEIAGHRVFFVRDGALAACFDDNIKEETLTEIAKRRPLFAVLRDSGLSDDSAAVNFEQIFKAYSPGTRRRVI